MVLYTIIVIIPIQYYTKNITLYYYEFYMYPFINHYLMFKNTVSTIYILLYFNEYSG